MLTAAIAERNFVYDQRERSYRSWEVKVLGKIVACSIQFEKADAAEKFMSQVDELSLELPEERKLREEYVPEQEAGTFEALRGFFTGGTFDPNNPLGETFQPPASEGDLACLPDAPEAMVAANNGWQWIDEDGPQPLPDPW